MPAGPLDRRVQLLAPSVARDPDYGSETVTYAAVATVWGRVHERSGGEAVLADQRVMTRDITDCGVGPVCGASPASISNSSVPSA